MCGCAPAIEQPGLSKQQRARTNACHFLGCLCRRAYPIERFRIAQESAGAVAARNDEEVDGRRCVEAVASTSANYQPDRTHLGLAKDTPLSRPIAARFPS